MKKFIFVALTALFLVSCGKEKSESENENNAEVEVKDLDKFSINFEGLYKLDDSLSLVYKKNGYWDFDHPVSLKIIGQDTPQKFTINIPEGDYLENFQITLSTNKDQKEIQLNSIQVFLNENIMFDGKSMVYVPYFNANEGLKWIEEKKALELFFGGKYPPGISGNEKFEQSLQSGDVK